MALRRAAVVALALRGAAAAALGAEPRPNLTEWKDKQAAKAAAADAKVAKEKKMAAVNKAVELMESLQAQVLEEGEAEAKTYDKFACFCKDTTKEKIEAITKNEDSKEALSATIEDLTTKREGHDKLIQEKQDEIAKLEEDQKVKDEERAGTKKEYDANAADLSAALDALTGAIKTLKASKKPSLAQVQSIQETVQTATLLADALGVGGPAAGKAAAFFLQQPANEVQMQDYDFHSDGIIETLEKLLDDFRKEKVEVDKTEVDSIKVYDEFTQTTTHAIKMANEVIDKTKKAREETIAEIEENAEELSTVEHSLLEDKAYTNKLSQMCTDKAKTWDQRSKMRAAELSTLTQAIGIIKDSVAANTTAAMMRLAQQTASVRYAKAVASSEPAMEAIEQEAEALDAAESFVQISSHRHRITGAARGLRGAPAPRRRASEEDAKSAVLSVLKSRGVQLKSTLLTSLASKIAADPLAKVKVLIQELIERLLQEAANEANHKGWCDKAQSDAKQRRDYASEEISALNAEMEKLEARLDSLKEDLATLVKEIGELKDARQKAEEDRAAESEENRKTVEEAQSGLDALQMCIDLMDKFYKSAKKETVDLSLAQQGPEIDAPDAGFDNGEAYTGAQSESGGILGMLDVMKSDFERTIEDTQMNEEEAKRDHLEFMTETGKSLAQKEEAEKQRTAQKEDAEEKYEEAETSFKEQSDKLNTALGELLELKPVCVDTGMSYEERVRLREEEIEALKKASCILEAYAQYGPEGAGDAC